MLDACVLAPMPLCDTLLRLAEEPAFYIPRWSGAILGEVCRTLAKFGYSPAQIQGRMRFMHVAFPGAVVECYEHLFPALGGIPEHDRHVMAAAIVGRATAIVSFNTRHFPVSVLERFELHCLTPGEFLLAQPDRGRQRLVCRLPEQVAACGMDFAELVRRFWGIAPGFVRVLTGASPNA